MRRGRVQDRKSPVKILHPDDPRHPNFRNDPRNRDKIKRLEERHGGGAIDHDVDHRLPPQTGNEMDEFVDDYQGFDEAGGGFSDEGLRITVANKGEAFPIADSAFYDEIQPQMTEQIPHDTATEQRHSLEKVQSNSPPRRKPPEV